MLIINFCGTRRNKMYNNGEDKYYDNHCEYNEHLINKHLDCESKKEFQCLEKKKELEQKAKSNFSNTASAVAQLYKDGCSGRREDHWISFQNAAEHTTVMYKDFTDGLKGYCEAADRYAVSKARKEIYFWLKRKKKFVRKDELMKFLAGSPPPYNRNISVLSKNMSSCQVTPDVTQWSTSAQYQIPIDPELARKFQVRKRSVQSNFPGHISPKRKKN